jgi:uncharacterized membrane protein
MIIVGALAVAVTVLVCWHWKIALLGGQYGLHGGWGFEIFVAAFAMMYTPVALFRRLRRREKPAKDDRGNVSER